MTDPTQPQSYDYELPYPPVPKRSEFAFGDMVFQLFRTPGGRDFGLRLWMWVTLGYSAIFLVMLPLVAGPYMDFIMAAVEMESIDGEVSSEEFGEFFGGMFAFMGVALVFLLAIWALIASGEAALHRRIFRGEEAARIPLRFGKDELRIMGAQFLLYLIFIGILFGAMILTVLTLFIGGLVIIPGAIVFSLLVLLMFCSASALSVKDRTFRFSESKHVTKNRRGLIFGAYAVIYIVSAVILSIIQYGALFAFLGTMDLSTLATEAGSETAQLEQMIESFNNPLVMLGIVLTTILYAAVTALLYLLYAGIGASGLLWYLRDRQLPPTQWELAAQHYQPPQN